MRKIGPRPSEYRKYSGGLQAVSMPWRRTRGTFRRRLIYRRTDKRLAQSIRQSSSDAAAAVIIGITLLGGALIYATYTKQTIPVTQLQPDANGQPVQPINPATGAEEQTLAAMPGSIPGSMSNTDLMAQPPGTLPGGDNYNPWATGAPPPGAPLPTYIPPGGQVYTIDPNNPSQFCRTTERVLVPVPQHGSGTNLRQLQGSAANSNTQAAPPATHSRKRPPTNKPATLPLVPHCETVRPTGADRPLHHWIMPRKGRRASDTQRICRKRCAAATFRSFSRVMSPDIGTREHCHAQN